MKADRVLRELGTDKTPAFLPGSFYVFTYFERGLHILLPFFRLFRDGDILFRFLNGASFLHATLKTVLGQSPSMKALTWISLLSLLRLKPSSSFILFQLWIDRSRKRMSMPICYLLLIKWLVLLLTPRTGPSQRLQEKLGWVLWTSWRLPTYVSIMSWEIRRDLDPVQIALPCSNTILLSGPV